MVASDEQIYSGRYTGVFSLFPPLQADVGAHQDAKARRNEEDTSR